ncbi:MAG: KH domain-containing protein [Nitrospinota bacterium]|nr:KH domain-containing protein [Nitrospinota bacterium]
MDWTEADGDTYEEAVEILLLSLGAHRSEVEIEEVGEKKKLFGLGKTVIRVRGRIKDEALGGAGVSIASLTSSLSSEIAKIGSGGQQQQQPPQVKEQAPAGNAQQVRERPPRKRKKGGGGDRAPEMPRKKSLKRNMENPPASKVFGQGTETETSKACKDFLERILAAMEIAGSVDAEENNGDIMIDIKSDSGGLIIGRKGETLDAITKIMEIYATRTKGSFMSVIVDTEDYRNRREVKLKELAISSAQKALETGKKVKLSPMKTDERKIIHFTLQDNPAVETRSEGRDDNRRIVIFPVRNGGN